MRSTPIGLPKGTTIFNEIEASAITYYEAAYLNNSTDFIASNDDSDPEDVTHRDTQPFGELEMLWMVENYHSLPYTGGLMDQPAILMRSLNICRSVRDRTIIIRDKIKEMRGKNPVKF